MKDEEGEVVKEFLSSCSLMLTAMNKDRRHGTGARPQVMGTRGQGSGGRHRVQRPAVVGGARGGVRRRK